MSSLIINEPPLQVLPSLALAVGLNEAIVLQQLHYLLAFATTTHQGKRWVYNSYEEWQAKQFRFWSVATIKRAFTNLQNQGLIICEKLQARHRNQTNFYTIDYDKLSQIQADLTANSEPMEQVKMTQSIGSNCTDGAGQFEPMSSAQFEPILQENTYMRVRHTRPKTSKHILLMKKIHKAHQRTKRLVTLHQLKNPHHQPNPPQLKNT